MTFKFRTTIDLKAELRKPRWRAATRCRRPSGRPRPRRSPRGRFRSPSRRGVIVSGFMPLKSEINPLPLMRKLADAGARLALPVVAGRGQPLIMRA